jgi:hypothetical protein
VLKITYILYTCFPCQVIFATLCMTGTVSACTLLLPLLSFTPPTFPFTDVQMYLEASYCINCWYKDLDEDFIKYPPFVVHYAGCQMCTGYHQDKV